MAMIEIGPCAKCACEVSLPEELYKAAKHSKGISFYCAYGHTMHFPQGESEAEKLRRERDRLAQQIAYKDDRIKELREEREAADRRTAAAKGQITKFKNRVGHGVCPCCNRTFENLSRHMSTKHPTFTVEAAE